MSSNEWKQFRLGDLIALNEKSINRTFDFDEIEYIDTSAVTQNNFEMLQILKLSDAPSRAKRIVQNGDTIISTVRPIQRHFGIIQDAKPNTIASTGFAVLTPKKIDADYLFYYLSQESITLYLNGIAETTTTTFPAFRPETLSDLEILIPENPNTQKQIANILSQLDSKIKLNRQTNETLEKLVNTLFQEMCVSKSVDLQDGWKLLKLEEFIELKNGYAFKGIDFIEEGVPVIKIKNVKAGKVILNQLSYVSREVADKTQRFRIKQNDLLITMSGNRIDGTPETWVGKVGIFHRDEEYLLNQRVSILKIIDDEQMSKYFLSQLLSSEEYQYYFISNATSSGGQANISPDLIYNTEIIVPPIEQLKMFNKLANDIYNKIFANELEVETLINLRNSLLPKLMKGEIKI